MILSKFLLEIWNFSSMARGGNAEKRIFDWVIAPLKDGCVFVE